MCYAKPGPRCYSHGKKAYDKASKKVSEAALQAFDADSTQADKRKYDTAVKKLLIAEENMYANEQGLQEYRQKMYKKAFAGELTLDNALLACDQMEEKYEERMKAYDRIHGTVHGKAPSAYWKRSDRQKLSIEHNKLNEKVHAMEDSEPFTHLRATDAEKKKLDNYRNRRQSCANKLKHANRTVEHIKDGIIKRPTNSTNSNNGSGKTNTVQSESPVIGYGQRILADQKKPEGFTPSRVKNEGDTEKVKAFKPEPHKTKNENGGFVGAKYDPHRTNRKVASETRKDLEKAVATKALPSNYEYKVTNERNRIEIQVVGDHKENYDTYQARHGGQMTRMSDDGIRLKDKVAAYANQYTYNQSQMQFDHMNQSHYVFVKLVDENGNGWH